MLEKTKNYLEHITFEDWRFAFF